MSCVQTAGQLSHLSLFGHLFSKKRLLSEDRSGVPLRGNVSSDVRGNGACSRRDKRDLVGLRLNDRLDACLCFLRELRVGTCKLRASVKGSHGSTHGRYFVLVCLLRALDRLLPICLFLARKCLVLYGG